VKQVAGKFTRRSSAAPTQHNNQIASFYTGAMANAASCRSAAWTIRAGDHLAERSGAMVQYARNAARWAFHTSSTRAAGRRMSGDELGTARSALDLICNDYEYEILKQKTGSTRRDPAPQCMLDRYTAASTARRSSRRTSRSRVRGDAAAHCSIRPVSATPSVGG
jgi:hypothetical protein